MEKAELIELLSGAISNERVLSAMASVPREEFVPPELRERAWENEPLPIGRGQTISQPVVVARMCEQLRLEGGETVLDVGTGSGYHAALLSRLARSVVSVERHPQLVDDARRNLWAAGVENVRLIVGDGRKGYATAGPYDAINVAAAIEGAVPPALLEQLADGGRMIAPIGRAEQRLVLLERSGEELRQEDLEWVRFVPLVDDS